jgi:hypothetical protein
MLKSILMVWVLAQNLALTQEAYEDYLGYRSVDAGVMSAELAAAIDRPELADRRFVTMMPRSGPQVGLRLVEGNTSGYVPMNRVGWSAIELLVKDPEQLESELPGSAFRHLQGPDFLTEQKNILAMQVTGPNQELFYLTHMIDPSKSFLRPQPSPESVGQTFIMVMGSPDLEASLAFWRRYFDNGIVGPIPYRIGVLSDAYDLPGETLHPLALVSMSDGYGIEIDQYPDEATAVPAPEGERGGVILVSLSVDPEGLKAPLPWRLPYTNTAGAVEGGIVTLPSGAPIEIALTNPMLPAPIN